jgi:hypothetical protein
MAVDSNDGTILFLGGLFVKIKTQRSFATLWVTLMCETRTAI